MIVDRLSMSVEDLHRSFGVWPIVWALMRAVRRQRRAEFELSHLSDYMLRDMGLPARQQFRPEGRMLIWKIRRH